jgi:uncharacterized protein YbcI
MTIADRPGHPESTPPEPQDPGRPEGRRPPPSGAEVNAELGRELLRIHEESYGRGAERAHAIVSEDWVVVVLDGLELLPNEEFLVEKGKAETVTQVRTQYQLAIRSSFQAAVERATGRTVIGFASATSLGDERFAAEVFKLR